MADRKASFKKADLERALKAIRDTGMTMAVEVTRDGTIRLIPLWAYNYVGDGETLVSIDGSPAVKGKDEIDLDVRFGCIAYGFTDPRRVIDDKETP